MPTRFDQVPHRRLPGELHALCHVGAGTRVRLVAPDFGALRIECARCGRLVLHAGALDPAHPEAPCPNLS